ncbi:MAG: hypothetical protein NVS1B10_08370 [Candidatus Saccharimonadales bacterium]
MEDIKGTEQIEKFLKNMDPDRLMEIYELCLQQEEDDSGDYYIDSLED